MKLSMFCGQCGENNQLANKYCTSCGARLGYDQSKPVIEKQQTQSSQGNTVAQLLEKLNAPDNSTRWQAAEKLGELKEPKAVPILIERLESSHDTIFQKWNIITVLGEIGDSRAVPALLPFLESEDGYVRWLVISAFEKIAEPSTFAIVEKHLKDKDECTRNAAAVTLYKIDPNKALPILKVHYKKSTEETRKTLKKSLGDIFN